MCRSPDFLRDRLALASLAPVDLLSDVIAVMRTGQPRSVHLTRHAPWSQWFDPVPGAVGFQVVLQGTCQLIPVDDAPIPLVPGDVVLLPHGRGHTLSGADGSTITLCGAYELDPARAHPLLLTLPEILHLPAGPAQHPRLRTAIDLLSAELTEPDLGTDAVLPALLDTLLVYALRTWIHQSPADSPTGWAAALNDPQLAAALHAVHHNPKHPWTVASLASEAGLSRAPFARRFTMLVGQPPLTYLTWWRMTMAARLLRDTSTPLSTIAREVGYGSEFAFAAAFKRSHGVPPGRYRRG